MPPSLQWAPNYFWGGIYKANISCLLKDIISSLNAENPTLYSCLQTAVPEKCESSVRTD